MSFITRLALRRRPVTILIMILLFALGVYSYINLQRELFPEISFPNIAVNAFYANSDPETLMRDVTEPIEDAISGLDGLNEIRSNSTESRLNLLATFDFGTDMKEAEREIEERGERGGYTQRCGSLRYSHKRGHIPGHSVHGVERRRHSRAAAARFGCYQPAPQPDRGRGADYGRWAKWRSRSSFRLILTS